MAGIVTQIVVHAGIVGPSLVAQTVGVGTVELAMTVGSVMVVQMVGDETGEPSVVEQMVYVGSLRPTMVAQIWAICLLFDRHRPMLLNSLCSNAD